MLSFREFFWFTALVAMALIYFTTGEIESMERVSFELVGSSIAYQAWDAVRGAIKSLTRRFG